MAKPKNVSLAGRAVRDIIVVGGSAGSVEAALTLARSLPARFPAAFFLVIHIGDRPSRIPEILSQAGPLPASFAVHGARIRPGRIYVAPPDNHLTLEEGRMRVVRGPRENGTRPAVDPLFRSAAQAYGRRVIGVVLSGTLDCGSRGLSLIKKAGGTAIVQHPEEALFPDMPLNAARTTRVDHQAPIEQMSRILTELAGTPIQGSALSRAARSGAARTRPTDLTCPDCHGTLAETGRGSSLQFACHVGHVFSPSSLDHEQSKDLEGALWSSVRALRESEAFNRRIASSGGAMRERFEEKADALAEHAALIERFVMGRALDAMNRPSTRPKARERKPRAVTAGSSSRTPL